MTKPCTYRVMLAITGRVPLSEVPQCGGSCGQGRAPCDCKINVTEEVMKPTTFPRTTTEAFNDADRAGCISGPFRSSNASTGRLLLAAVVLVGLIVATAFGVPA